MSTPVEPAGLAQDAMPSTGGTRYWTATGPLAERASSSPGPAAAGDEALLERAPAGAASPIAQGSSTAS